MQRISVADAGRRFAELVDRVAEHGITVELARDNRIVARLSPAERQVRVSDLNKIFAALPPLGEDAEPFAKDVENVRRAIPQETDPWD